MRVRKPYWPASLSPVHSAHLQAADAYGEGLRAVALRRLLPDAHGIVEIDCDDEALRQGYLIARKLDVIFPSGFEAWLDEDMPRLEADVRVRLHELSPRIMVYLGVAKAVLDGPNVSLDDKSARATRYVGRPDIPIPWMRPKLEFLFAGDDLARYETVVVGCIEQVGHAYRWANTIWPTVIRAQACRPIIGCVQAVVHALEQRKDELLAERQHSELSLTGSVPSNLSLELHVLVARELAVLKAMLAYPPTPPYEFYRRLRRLYLGLIAFTEEWERPPAYDHDRLVDVVPWFTTRIVRWVDLVVRDDVTRLSFEASEGNGMFSLQFRREDLVGKRPFLVATSENEGLLDRLPLAIKMAAPSAIAECMSSSVSGVRLDRELDPSPELPQGTHTAVYRIRERDRPNPWEPQRPAFWSDILGCGEIRVFLPSDSALQLHLYAISRDAE